MWICGIWFIIAEEGVTLCVGVIFFFFFFFFFAVNSCLMVLVKANFEGAFSEATTAQKQTIFTDQALMSAAFAALTAAFTIVFRVCFECRRHFFFFFRRYKQSRNFLLDDPH